ncbi:hypothetical protein DH2020_042786 [Rehmannia glutinosa]|uniref:mitogen-activated protein kinase kinase n=1 Tax=Rehmannia glutinosa TaxID=99300 RepID=A0ABR0UNF0_REHGL
MGIELLTPTYNSSERMIPIQPNGYHGGYFHQDSSSSAFSTDDDEKTYRCASHEMRVFGSIGSGASSVVQRAIHIPNHRIIALKKINIFEKEKRQQLLTEIRTLCEAPCYQGLVQFYGAFYTPESGQISIALEYMDGSLADIIRIRKSIPEPILSAMVHKLLLTLSSQRYQTCKFARKSQGGAKITDFGISAGLEDSMAMELSHTCLLERIRNENYSYPADIWSLGLALFECATGEFPYTANEGPVNLMLQLLSHPFIKKYEDTTVNLEAFVQSIFDPTQRLKDLADMLTIHYYLLFDGSDDLWRHMKTLYEGHSVFSFGGKESVGPNDIFSNLSNIRRTLAGNWPPQKLVHVVEKLQCRAHGQNGIAIRVSGSFIVGNQFLICGDGVQVEGLPNFSDLSIDIPSKRVGTFREQFILETSDIIGRYFIAKQELYIVQ